MFDRSDLRAAVEAGALSDEAAGRFEAFLRARNDPDRMLDPENLRFLTNFNDIFLAIGMAILMTGIGFLSGIFMTNVLGLGNLDSEVSFEAAAGKVKLAAMLAPIPVLAAAWLLAEYFCGRRRLLLPSMILSVVICGAVASIALAIVAPIDERIAREGDLDVGDILSSLWFAGFGASAVAALGIFARFRLPFSLFLAALSIAGLAYTAIVRLGGGDLLLGGAAALAVGLVTLAAAISFDMRDPQRASRTSDCAFWLHMAAAPQIMFGLRGLILGSGFAPAGTVDAAIMLAVLVGFAVLSLALNRRALIVSGLVSFAVALWVLVDRVGGGGLNTVMLTALIVGGSIVLLGGGWRTARRLLLAAAPKTGLSARIFPPEPA